jgi:hypothetical protein
VPDDAQQAIGHGLTCRNPDAFAIANTSGRLCAIVVWCVAESRQMLITCALRKHGR